MSFGVQLMALSSYAAWSVQALEVSSSPLRSEAYSNSIVVCGMAGRGVRYARTLMTFSPSRSGSRSEWAKNFR